MVTGLVISSAKIIRPSSRGSGEVLFSPWGVPGQLATLNTLRNPRRTAATATALIIGVTLVATILVGGMSTKATLSHGLDQRYPVDISVPLSGLVDDDDLEDVRQIPGVSAAVIAHRAEAVETQGLPSEIFVIDPTVPRPCSVGAADIVSGRVTVPEDYRDPTVRVKGLNEMSVPVHKDGLSSLAFFTTPDVGNDLGISATTTAVLVRLDEDIEVDEITRIRQSVAETLDVSSEEVGGSAVARGAYSELIDVMLAGAVALLFVSVIIALIGVSNTVSLSVIERRRENALMRALGLSISQLRTLLALEACSSHRWPHCSDSSSAVPWASSAHGWSRTTTPPISSSTSPRRLSSASSQWRSSPGSSPHWHRPGARIGSHPSKDSKSTSDVPRPSGRRWASDRKELMTSARIRILIILGIVVAAFNLRPGVTGLSPLLDAMGEEIRLSATFLAIIGMLPPLLYGLSGFITRASTPASPDSTDPGRDGHGHDRIEFGRSSILCGSSSPQRARPAGDGHRQRGPPASGEVVFPDKAALCRPCTSGCSSALHPVAGRSALASFGWRGSLVAGPDSQLWVFSPDRHPHRQARTSRRGGRRVVGGSELSRLLRSPRAWALMTMTGLTSFNNFILFTWLPSLLTRSGFDAAFGGAMLALVTAIPLVLGFVLPTLAQKMTSAYLIVVGFCISLAVGYLGLWLVPTAAPVLWTVLLGIGISTFPLALTLITLRARDAKGAAALSGFVQGGGYLLAATGPLIFAFLIQSFDSMWPAFAVVLASVVVKFFVSHARRPGAIWRPSGHPSRHESEDDTGFVLAVRPGVLCSSARKTCRLYCAPWRRPMPVL